MKILLNSLTIALIAGMLIFAIADEVKPTAQSRVGMLDYVNTTVEDIEELDRKLCEKNGGAGTYDEHKKSRDQFDTCVRGLQDEMMQEVMAAQDPSMPPKLEEFYRSFCTKRSKFANCLKNLTDSMKTCLDVSKHESANILYSTFDSVTQFLCENDGGHFETFLTSGGEDCLNYKMSDLRMCSEHTFMKYIKSTIPDGVAVGKLKKLHLLVPDVEKCTVLNNFQVCALDQLKGCRDRATADLATLIFGIVKKATTCDRLVKSDASPANVVDVLLITALSAFMSIRVA